MIALSKVNLVLNVCAERQDGFHELDTVFYPLSNPADEVSLSFDKAEQPGVRIVCDHPGVPQDPMKNLCGKAVYAYCRAGNIPVPACTVSIRKNIPCAGGMAGGSTDGAAVLLLLQEHYHLLTDQQLHDTAFSLGADVPFFLNPVPSRAGGAGELLTPVAGLPGGLPIVIAAPDFPISAKWSYQHWTPADALATDTADRCLEALKNGDLPEAAKFMKNSLAPAAFRKFPLLRILKETFMEQGALTAELSGSGPAIFALFPDHAAAHRGCDGMKKRFSSVRFFC